MHQLFLGDCRELLPKIDPVACIFADPPDAIGLGYDGYDDNTAVCEYRALLEWCVFNFPKKSRIFWISFNAKWLPMMGSITEHFMQQNADWQWKPNVQTFTFAQHNQNDFANAHRPLWRYKRNDAPLFPNHCRVRSWRQENGDPRACPDGRVPSDHFDFPRVVGNSPQRRNFHPTQLHEGLVARCVNLSTRPEETVLDCFLGSGTTLRVCKALHRNCIGFEVSPRYCAHIAAEHGMEITARNHWELKEREKWWEKAY